MILMTCQAFISSEKYEKIKISSAAVVINTLSVKY